MKCRTFKQLRAQGHAGQHHNVYVVLLEPVAWGSGCAITATKIQLGEIGIIAQLGGANVPGEPASFH